MKAVEQFDKKWSQVLAQGKMSRKTEILVTKAIDKILDNYKNVKAGDS